MGAIITTTPEGHRRITCNICFRDKPNRYEKHIDQKLARDLMRDGHELIDITSLTIDEQVTL